LLVKLVMKALGQTASSMLVWAALACGTAVVATAPHWWSAIVGRLGAALEPDRSRIVPPPPPPTEEQIRAARERLGPLPAKRSVLR
jgi:hypothetical protein